jgi:hypothetical protein
MKSAKKRGIRVSKYTMAESNMIIIVFSLSGLCNLISLLYPHIPSVWVMVWIGVWFYLTTWMVIQYFARAIVLFSSVKFPIPRYISQIQWILSNKKRLFVYHNIINLPVTMGIILSFVCSSMTDLLYLQMGCFIAGVICIGFPTIYVALATLQYFNLWEDHISEIQTTLNPTTSSKFDNTILSAINQMKRTLIILSIATCSVVLNSLLLGSLLPFITHNATSSYFFMICQDFLLPIGFFIASIPTTIMIFQQGESVKWNDPMEDLQESVKKSISIMKTQSGESSSEIKSSRAV